MRIKKWNRPIIFTLTVINASAAVTLLEQRPEKIQPLSGIRTHDLCNASAVLSQLSYQSHITLLKGERKPRSRILYGSLKVLK